jgi:hypothetical protein
MTVLEAVWRHKPLIAVANTALPGNHQAKFLRVVSEEFDILWTEDPKELGDLLKRVHARDETPFEAPHLSTAIRRIMCG